MRFFRVLSLVGLVTLSGCSDSGSTWVPNEKLLAELVTVDVEAEPARAGKLANEFFGDAVSNSETGIELSGSKRAQRFREAFAVVRERFAAGGEGTAGFNACFPESFTIPKDSDGRDIGQFMERGWQCQLIQRDGPSVAKLRMDPLVTKYLDETGNLVALGEVPQMHSDVNGAFVQRDPNDDQVVVNSLALAQYEKILNAWER
jgi:hypothetical protein